MKGRRFFAHRNLRVAMLSQHHIDSMANYLQQNALEYLQSIGKHYTRTMTEPDLRAYLGGFGLSGSIALQKLATYSGGQKARLALAGACVNHPHILLLDEPTNNLSMDAAEALSDACIQFEGAIVVISHNQFFLNNTCKVLCVVENGTAKIIRSVIRNDPVVSKTSTKSKSNKKEDLRSSQSIDPIGETTFADILNSYVAKLTSHH